MCVQELLYKPEHEFVGCAGGQRCCTRWSTRWRTALVCPAGELHWSHALLNELEHELAGVLAGCVVCTSWSKSWLVRLWAALVPGLVGRDAVPVEYAHVHALPSSRCICMYA
jgi:hypothetical protein